MSTTYKKQLPVISDANRPFWEGCKAGELRMQQCSHCGHIRYPIGPVCTVCLSDEFTWTKLSGKGTVFNYVIFYQKYNDAWADDLPYNVIMVQLDEGPRMFSNMVGIPNEEIRIGMPVEVVFEKATEDIYIPKFKPIEQ